MTKEELDRTATDIRFLIDLLALILKWCDSDPNDTRKQKIKKELIKVEE